MKEENIDRVKYPEVSRDLIGKTIKVLDDLSEVNIKGKTFKIENIVFDSRGEYSYLELEGYSCHSQKGWCIWNNNLNRIEPISPVFEVVDIFNSDIVFNYIDELLRQKENGEISTSY